VIKLAAVELAFKLKNGSNLIEAKEVLYCPRRDD
jgi:hypothetical protein